MRFFWHLKKGLWIGLIVGFIFSLINIFAKVLATNFVWYEIYQNLTWNGIFFAISYAMASICVSLWEQARGKRFKERKLITVYAVTSFFLILGFNTLIVLHEFLLDAWSILNDTRKGSIVTLLVAAAYLVAYVLILRSPWLKRVSGSKIADKKLREISINFVLIITVFILVSFAQDIYMYKNPVSGSDPAPPTADPELPNIILISLDTVRADHLTIYNYSKNTTPFLERFSEEAVVFENAISASSWTLPAHSSIFTGLYPEKHGAISTAQKLKDEGIYTIAELLKDQGYVTSGFVSLPYMKAKYGVAQGIDVHADRLHFTDHRDTFDKFSFQRTAEFYFPWLSKLSPSLIIDDPRDRLEKPSVKTNQEVFLWLDRPGRRGPFFMLVHYADAHHPHQLGEEFYSWYIEPELLREYGDDERTVAPSVGERFGEVDLDMVKTAVGKYDAEIRYQDRSLEDLIDKLDELGFLDNSVIIIFSDHGEEFYEHGGFQHGNTLYQEQIHVPLVIRYPGFTAQRIEDTVETLDIFSTVMDIVGIKIKHDVDSTSLVPLITGGTSDNESVSQIVGRGGYGELTQRATIRDRWKYISVGRGETPSLPSALFDLDKNPKEDLDLDLEYERPGIVEELEDLADQKLSS